MGRGALRRRESLTTTLADYAVPSSAELPSFELGHTQMLSPNNASGAKGIGESATIGSTPAVQNAVIDALSHLASRLSPVWRLVVLGAFAP